jgi:hypothetical protein
MKKTSLLSYRGNAVAQKMDVYIQMLGHGILVMNNLK